MPTSKYPSQIDKFPVIDPTQSLRGHASLHNAEEDAIEKIESTLGVNPQGTHASVSARIANVEAKSSTPGPAGQDGKDGKGWTDGYYVEGTGKVVFASDDGLGFSTGDLRGSNGTAGTDGKGFTGGSYNATTGVVTFLSDDGLGFATGDLRGANGEKGDPFVYDDFTPAQLDGLKGPQGEKGNDGTGVNILGSYNSEAELNAAHPSGNVGDAYLVAGDLYVWDDTNSTWDNVGNIQGPPGENGVGEKGDDGADGKGWTAGGYDPSTGVVTFDSNDGLGFSTTDLRGANGTDGKGFTGGSYDVGTGIVTFTSADGLGFSTDDLRGADGQDGEVGEDGKDGKGWYEGTYDESTGIVTFLSNDGLTFATGDLRGADGVGNDYDDSSLWASVDKNTADIAQLNTDLNNLVIPPAYNDSVIKDQVANLEQAVENLTVMVDDNTSAIESLDQRVIKTEDVLLSSAANVNRLNGEYWRALEKPTTQQEANEIFYNAIVELQEQVAKLNLQVHAYHQLPDPALYSHGDIVFVESSLIEGEDE
jgi:tetrahydromethanopterin S-methyltransferase subunit B